MYLHHIIEMTDAIVARHEKYPKEPMRQCAHNAILGCWQDKIAVVWHVDDVINTAKDRGIKLTKGDAYTILRTTLDKHDTEVGVGWEVLVYHIEEFADRK